MISVKSTVTDYSQISVEKQITLVALSRTDSLRPALQASRLVPR